MEHIPKEYLQVDQIDRDHTVAQFIDANFYSEEARANRRFITNVAETLMGVDVLGPVEQAEFVIREDEVFKEMENTYVDMAEYVYNQNPKRSQTMDSDDFDQLVFEYDALEKHEQLLKYKSSILSDLLSKFRETKSLNNFVDRKGIPWKVEQIGDFVFAGEWAGTYGNSSLLEAQYVLEGAVYKSATAVPGGSNEVGTATPDRQHFVNDYLLVDLYLQDAVCTIRIQEELAEIERYRYIVEHGDKGTKPYEDAKMAYNRARQAINRSEWEDHLNKISEWYEAVGEPFVELDKDLWSHIDHDLVAITNEVELQGRVMSDAEAQDITSLAKKLADFRPRSLDTSVALRLIKEGDVDEVLENFRVFTGDSVEIARYLLEHEGFEKIAENIHKFHNLDSDFMHTFLAAWDKAFIRSGEEGALHRDWVWPLGLYYPAAKMKWLIDNLESFGTLDASIPFDIVTRMYVDRDHGAESLNLIPLLMGHVGQFEPFDHVEFAKHIASETCIPHMHDTSEVILRLLDSLQIEDTSKGHAYIRSILESNEKWEIMEVLNQLPKLNEENITFIRAQIGDPTFVQIDTDIL